mmetsp:Transcript_38863/g.91478  ORF Transcript_38863/g.91478 Transcript_38863/m.91478 type:complete len:358 (+) Transcript_38863:117-1190(+)|eukprot:CAMPEP_0178389724 /NCGR_PEP_ID=MMETSP0689_2-20121128/10274_1 /TAXON_ID=160604 /ORGANISM="Amphidinium massartii, Strain CS-259" /LENGTH=357 /DNA_ID=CAMNT_0020010203 /DNA_START=28 /DNA_END=1101 /DNA_ORIENTATION=+
MAVQGWNRWAVKFVVISTRLWLTVLLMALALLVLPASVVKRVRFLEWAHRAVRKRLHTAYELSKQGPFFRLFAFCCRRLGGRKVASQCRPPTKLRVQAKSLSEVEVIWIPDFPSNPLHEEHYVCSWKVLKPGSEADAADDGDWCEKEWLPGAYDHAKKNKKDTYLPSKTLKAALGGFAPNTVFLLRLCAVGASGRSPWSSVVQARTLASPSKECGFEGPLSRKAPITLGGSFRWFQTKHEVGARIPVEADWKPREMKVKATPSRIEVKHVGAEQEAVLLAGDLGSKIVADEVFWELADASEEEPRRHLSITLRKAELMEKWSCFLDEDDHPKLDTSVVQLYTEGNAWNELSTRDLWD